MAQDIRKLLPGTEYGGDPEGDFMAQMYDGDDDDGGGSDATMKRDNTRTPTPSPRGTTDKKYSQAELLKLLEGVPKEKRERFETKLEGGQKLRVSGDDMEVLDSNGMVQQMFKMPEQGGGMPSGKRDSGNVDGGLMPNARKGQGLGQGEGGSSGGNNDRTMQSKGSKDSSSGDVGGALEEMAGGQGGDVYGGKPMASVYADNESVVRRRLEKMQSPEELRAAMQEGDSTIKQLESQRKSVMGDSKKERFFMAKMNEAVILRDMAKQKLAAQRMGGK